MLLHTRSPLYPTFEDAFSSGTFKPREQSLELLIERLTTQVVKTTLQQNPNLPFEKFEQAINSSIEYLMGSLFMSAYPNTISVFGSSTAKPGTVSYESARAFAENVTANSENYIITGGGPGIMEAASVGAGRERCLGAALKLSHETGPNPHIDSNRLLKFNSFPPRISTLSYSSALIMAEGGVGTLEEGFKIIDLIVKGNIPPKAVLWLGKEFWEETIDPLVKFMINNGFLDPALAETLFYERSDDPKQLAQSAMKSLADNAGEIAQWKDPNENFDVNTGDITTSFPILNNQQFSLNAEGRGLLVRVQRHVFNQIDRITDGIEEKLDKKALVSFFKDFLDAVYVDAVLDKHLNGKKATLLLGDTASPDFQQQLSEAKSSGRTILAKSDFRNRQNCIILWRNEGAGQFGEQIFLRFKYTGLQAFAHHSDQIVVCPGGTGTYAALSQMLTWKQTRQLSDDWCKTPINFIGEEWFDLSFTQVIKSMAKRAYVNKSPGDDDSKFGRLIESVNDL